MTTRAEKAAALERWAEGVEADELRRVDTSALQTLDESEPPVEAALLAPTAPAHLADIRAGSPPATTATHRQWAVDPEPLIIARTAQPADDPTLPTLTV